MNERIKELAEQALGVKRDGPTVWQFYDDELKKFAELIVKECATICDQIYFDNYPDAEDWEHSQEGDAIKEHFGVED
jgi:hypothetical protein